MPRSDVPSPETWISDLDDPYQLTQKQIDSFRRDGFIKLKHVLSPAIVVHFGNEITKKVSELNQLRPPLMQAGNIWRSSTAVARFVFSSRLARLAAELLGVHGVRLYHDQALYKLPSSGPTSLHSDHFYWPLLGDLAVTVWIPLQCTPIEMGPLRFAAQSHRCNACRAFEAKSQSQKELDAEIRNCGFRIVEEPFELGELSYHYGWTYHSAGRNSTDRAREVITIIYMDQDIKLAEPTIDWHAKEISKWTPGIKPGEVPASQFNPVLWSS